MIRNSSAVVRAIWETVPLASVHKQVLLDNFTAVIRPTTVKGKLLAVIIQVAPEKSGTAGLRCAADRTGGQPCCAPFWQARSHMPDYVVTITTPGGLAVFGINGFVLGPVIAAMFIAVWHIGTNTQVDTSQLRSVHCSCWPMWANAQISQLAPRTLASSE